MKKFTLFVIIIISSVTMNAQWLWDYGINIGATNYLGDIGGKEKTRRDFIADMKLSKTRWNVGGFVRYKWRPKISLRLAFDYIRVEGDDKLSSNPGRNYRNFNFKNDLFDLGLTGHWFFYEDNDLGNTYRYRNGFRAYIFGGVGGFYTNPKSKYQGEWVKMKDYDSEGYNYKSIVLNIPYGFEANVRKTFTDYIDDISGNYPEDPGNDYERGLFLRTTELPAEDIGAYRSHTWGMKRGDKTHKDSYMNFSLSYSYVIRGKSSFYRTRYKGNFFTKNKRKVRKIRAKF
jgi:hypothetical protein